MRKQVKVSPIVLQLQEIRKAHRVSQLMIETRMGLPPDTVRHIEAGRRPLPDLHQGFGDFVRQYLTCANATPDERARMNKTVYAYVLFLVCQQLDGDGEDDGAGMVHD